MPLAFETVPSENLEKSGLWMACHQPLGMRGLQVDAHRPFALGKQSHSNRNERMQKSKTIMLLESGRIALDAQTADVRQMAHFFASIFNSLKEKARTGEKRICLT